MLNEERKIKIVRTIDRNGSASIQDLMVLIGASESTIRRDLNELDKQGLIMKVHGGAVSKKEHIVSSDTHVQTRQSLFAEEKIKIGKYAASLIEEGDTIFIDAGTTTAALIEHITVEKAIFFTHAIAHARRLAEKGYTVFLPSGYIKQETEAIVGPDTFAYFSKCNFSKAFFGTNGISSSSGFSTPDPIEGSIKECAFNHSKEKYVLADSSKFGQISAKTFGQFEQAIVITNKDETNIYCSKPNVISLE